MCSRILKLVFIGVAVLLIQACSHPIEIEGQGDVMSASGTRTCLLENFQAGDDVCSKNYAVGAYQETYYPTAKPGWKFDHWVTYCANALPPNYDCSFDVSAELVLSFWGKAVLPLKAVFTPIPPADTDGDGLNDEVDPCPANPTNPCALITGDDVVAVEGHEWAQVDLFGNTSWNEIDAVCPGGACSGILNGYDVSGWTWASVDDVNRLLNSYDIDPSLGPGPTGPSYKGNSAWADAFSADGWRGLPGNDCQCIPVQGFTSDGIGTEAYIGRLDNGSIGNWDIASTNETYPKGSGVSYLGAWLFRATPITDIVAVGDRQWAQPDFFRALSWNQIQAECPGGVCGSGAELNGWDVSGWILASVDDVNDLFNVYIGDSVMGPGPDSAYAPGWNAWGSLLFNDGFRLTVRESIYSRAIEGLTADEVVVGSDRVHVGVFVDSGSSSDGPDSARTYGSHGKDDGYGFTGAWFYKLLNLSGSTNADGSIAWDCAPAQAQEGSQAEVSDSGLPVCRG